MDVLSPGVSKQPLGDGPDLAPALGDATVEAGRNLADGAAVDPPVLPEERVTAVPNRHGGGGKEQRSFLGRELQV
jgi:hypothetical protein